MSKFREIHSKICLLIYFIANLFMLWGSYFNDVKSRFRTRLFVRFRTLRVPKIMEIRNQLSKPNLIKIKWWKPNIHTDTSVLSYPNPDGGPHFPNFDLKSEVSTSDADKTFKNIGKIYLGIAKVLLWIMHTFCVIFIMAVETDVIYWWLTGHQNLIDRSKLSWC